MHKPFKTLVNAAVLSVLTQSAAQAGAFSLYTESSPAAIGNFAAGSAAEGRDASIGWYNPAGLVLIKEQQAVLGGVGVFPKATLSGTSTFIAPGPFGFPDYVESFRNIHGEKSALVPSFHYARPLGDRVTFGLSMVTPFGLATDWGDASPVRYQATYTELVTFNVSPQIGGKITDNFAIGGGLDLQYAQVKFNRVLGVPVLLSVLEDSPMLVDSRSYNKGDSYGLGFHAGILATSSDNHTRFGMNYQSQVRHKFHGSSRLSGPLADTGNIFLFDELDSGAVAVSDNLSSTDVTLPDIVTLSAYQDVNERVALLGSALYTGWSTFKTIQLNNVQAPIVSPIDGDITQGVVNSASAQNYKNVWRFALGANVQINPRFMMRLGGGYDATPTNNTDRDARLPDADRWALSLGGHWQMRNNLGFDLGYTRLFSKDTPVVNRTDTLTPTTFYNVTARGRVHANLIGAQLVWSIDKEGTSSI